MQINGVVQIVKNNGKMWSIKVSDAWYGCGFKVPKCKEGDNVTFEAKQNGQYLNVANVEAIVVQEAPKQEPKTVKATGAGKEDYWQAKAAEDSKNQHALRWQGARTNAIQVVDLLIKNDAVSIGKAKDAKYDIVMELIDLVTDRFYQQGVAMYESDGDSGAALQVGAQDYGAKTTQVDEE